jgi:predicted ArsR family transcriptional regulator
VPAAPLPTTDGGPDADEDGYRVLAGILAARLERESGADAAREAAAAGRDWARTLAPVADLPSPATPAQARRRVVQVLDGMGFAPADTGPDGPIELHRCPFLQVAEEHSLVVCGVHLGLMQGVLDDVAAPVGVARLEPFVAPGLCLAHLEPPTSDVPRPTGQGTRCTEGSPS